MTLSSNSISDYACIITKLKSGWVSGITHESLKWSEMALSGDEIVIVLYKISIIWELSRGGFTSHNPKVRSSNSFPATKPNQGVTVNSVVPFSFSASFSNVFLTDLNAPSRSSTCCLLKLVSLNRCPYKSIVTWILA